MFPHGGTFVPPTPLEQLQSFLEDIDPMTALMAGIAVMLVFMLYVAVSTEEER